MPETILCSSIIGSLLVALALGVALVVLLLWELRELKAKLALKDRQLTELYEAQEAYKPFSMRL